MTEARVKRVEARAHNPETKESGAAKLLPGASQVGSDIISLLDEMSTES